MKSNQFWQQPKRIIASAVTAVFFLQAVTPAFAQRVSQTPGLFVPAPDPNVMFTLDNSTSMRSDAIPDWGSEGNYPRLWSYDGNQAATGSLTAIEYGIAHTNITLSSYERGRIANARLLRSFLRQSFVLQS